MSIGVYLDCPATTFVLQCDVKNTTVSSFISLVQAEASNRNIQQDLARYKLRGIRYGEDVVCIEDMDQTLAVTGIDYGSTIVFLAPLDIKPMRGQTKKEKAAEISDAQVSKQGDIFGTGEYKQFSLGNCFKKMREAKEGSEQAKLVREFIGSKATDIFVKRTDYCKLSQAQLCEILAIECLTIKEELLYDAVQVWAKANHETKLEALFEHIRFPIMELKDIAKLDIFSADEHLRLFAHTAIPLSLRPPTLAGFSDAQCRVRTGFFIGAMFDKWGSTLTPSEDKRQIKYSGSSNWQGAALCTPAFKFSFKVVENCSNLMVGFGKEDLKLEGNNYSSSTGYYLYLNNWGLYGVGKSGNSYASGCVNSPGTIVTCEWKPDDGTISFYFNGSNKGVAYTGVPNTGLFPAFDFYDSNCTVELCEDPKEA